MQKIIVIGCPGSGKSTLAIKLKEKLNVPLLHLDKLYHIDNTQHISREQLVRQVAKFSRCNTRWIIDGNYISTLEQRILLADTIIWLDIDSKTCLKNAVARTKQPKRQDMAAGFDNTKISQEFIGIIKNFEQDTRPKILSLMQKHADKNYIILKDYLQIEQFLNDI